MTSAAALLATVPIAEVKGELVAVPLDLQRAGMQWITVQSALVLFRQLEVEGAGAPTTAAVLRHPEVLEDLADRLQRATRQAEHGLAELEAIKLLYRRLHPRAAAIADEVWPR